MPPILGQNRLQKLFWVDVWDKASCCAGCTHLAVWTSSTDFLDSAECPADVN